ncbi:MAG: hypothetical protein ABSG03_14115 [Bryobacteraceae bacterium]|jgi:hypothetical protein
MSKNDNRREPDSRDILGHAVEVVRHIVSAGSAVVGNALDAGRELVEQQGDGAERLAVYERIGEFIAKQYGLQPKLGYQTAIHLTGLGDDAVAQVPPPPQAVIAVVKKSLLMIRLEYLAKGHEYSRVLSFWYLRGDKPTRQTVSEGLTWDTLPGDVRAQWQRDREPVAFRLYSEEN